MKPTRREAAAGLLVLIAGATIRESMHGAEPPDSIMETIPNPKEGPVTEVGWTPTLLRCRLCGAVITPHQTHAFVIQQEDGERVATCYKRVADAIVDSGLGVRLSNRKEVNRG